MEITHKNDFSDLSQYLTSAEYAANQAVIAQRGKLQTLNIFLPNSRGFAEVEENKLEKDAAKVAEVRGRIGALHGGLYLKKEGGNALSDIIPNAKGLSFVIYKIQKGSECWLTEEKDKPGRVLTNVDLSPFGIEIGEGKILSGEQRALILKEFGPRDHTGKVEPRNVIRLFCLRDGFSSTDPSGWFEIYLKGVSYMSYSDMCSRLIPLLQEAGAPAAFSGNKGEACPSFIYTVHATTAPAGDAHNNEKLVFTPVLRTGEQNKEGIIIAKKCASVDLFKRVFGDLSEQIKGDDEVEEEEANDTISAEDLNLEEIVRDNDPQKSLDF
jgi:hypothetical protein